MKKTYEKTYNRLEVGGRLRLKRNLLMLTQDEMAEKIGRAPKYYADIERGSCGMSVETLMALSETLHMSMDYVIYGKGDESEIKAHTNELEAINDMLKHTDERTRQYALRMLKLFIAACTLGGEQEPPKTEPTDPSN